VPRSWIFIFLVMEKPWKIDVEKLGGTLHRKYATHIYIFTTNIKRCRGRRHALPVLWPSPMPHSAMELCSRTSPQRHETEIRRRIYSTWNRVTTQCMVGTNGDGRYSQRATHCWRLGQNIAAKMILWRPCIGVNFAWNVGVNRRLNSDDFLHAKPTWKLFSERQISCLLPRTRKCSWKIGVWTLISK